MADNNRTTTTTQIRNMYSDGMCYLNTKFFNTYFGFTFYPFLSKDNLGRSNYDLKNGLSTTVNISGAYGLYQICNDIISGYIKEIDHTIPCAGGATLNFKCTIAPNGAPDIIFSITKNNITIPFKFNVIAEHIKNSQNQNEIRFIYTDLGAFMMTIQGYLNGINADRHLDKLTDDYVKSLQDNQQQPSQQKNYNNNNNSNPNNNNNYRGNNNYNNNGNYKKGYNNNYKRQYNNNNNNGGYNNPNAQNFSSYEIKN